MKRKLFNHISIILHLFSIFLTWLLNDEGIVTCFSVEQKDKPISSVEVTELGIFISVKPQKLNTDFPNEVNEEGSSNVNFVK